MLVTVQHCAVLLAGFFCFVFFLPWTASLNFFDCIISAYVSYYPWKFWQWLSVSLVIRAVTDTSNLCAFLPAGCVRHSYVPLRHAVGPADQRSDTARSIRRHQVLPLPGHFPSLWPSGRLGLTVSPITWFRGIKGCASFKNTWKLRVTLWATGK